MGNTRAIAPGGRYRKKIEKKFRSPGNVGLLDQWPDALPHKGYSHCGRLLERLTQVFARQASISFAISEEKVGKGAGELLAQPCRTGTRISRPGESGHASALVHGDEK